ncbi:MAG: hypothetical protein PHH36_03250 [Sideroxydans sp.]|nr:hypothetical protein [Sideroxydans sp.]
MVGGQAPPFVGQPFAIPAGALRDNALAIAGNLANRASMQLTWSF